LVDRASQQRHPVSQKPNDEASGGFYEPPVLSPDSAWLALINTSPSKQTVTVYDLLGDGTPVSHQIAGSFGPIGLRAPVGFSPDGRWLVFLDPSDTVELWPVGRPEPPVTITVPGLHGLTALSVAPA
jgi:hypothetical protein